MAEPITINPEEPVNTGLDFAFLKEEAVAFTQRLSNDLWTDYNEHDPGVTTLEQLCYALTELSYRAQIPLEDLLAEKAHSKIDLRHQALFPAKRILPCNPVTPDDYRTLIVDRIPEVANAWLTPLAPSAHGNWVNGLYDVALYIPEPAEMRGQHSQAPPTLDCEPCDPTDPELILTKARRVYSRHRGLCEDFRNILILKPIRTLVSAEATLEGEATPELTLANILFNLGNFLAPELERRSLKMLLGLGFPATEIFNGPLLLNGFFVKQQLLPKAERIPVQDVARVIAGSSGVAGVREVDLRAADRCYQGDQVVPVPTDKILKLDPRHEKPPRAFTIRLFRDGHEIQPDPLRVERELARKWTNYRVTYKLARQYQEFFSIPQGSYRDLAQYYSIQNQFPKVYGIGSYGLSSHSPNVRRGQAKQLKGYLLVFDQLLANFFAQLAQAKDLFSIQRELPHTYFYQFLESSVPGVEPLLKKKYREGLAALVHSQDPSRERRNRLLDFLLALYAEDLAPASLLPCFCEGRPLRQRSIQAKLALLHHLVTSTHNRGRGFDYLAPDSQRNVAGMEIKSRIQLGMSAFPHRPLSDLLEELAIELVASDAEMPVTGLLSRHGDHIEEHFAPIRSAPAESPSKHQTDATSTDFIDDPCPPRPVAAPPRLRWRSLDEDLLEAAAEIENFRFGVLAQDQTVSAVCKTKKTGNWYLLEKYTDLDSAEAGARLVVEWMRKLRDHFRQLYIVEHNLLRFGRPYTCEEASTAGSEGADFIPFCYSFTLTAVVSARSNLRNRKEYRAFVRQIIRENAPSHIVDEYCFRNVSMTLRHSHRQISA